MCDGRFHRNGQWVFIRCGKLLEQLQEPKAIDEVIINIDVMIDHVYYHTFSVNIHPHVFDEDGDGRIDGSRNQATAGVARIVDHCWERGVFCALSFETHSGRLDDSNNTRLGDHETFLSTLEGANTIRIAAHSPWPWGTTSWNEVLRVNRRLGKGWAISEHMTATGTSRKNDRGITSILGNSLLRGTQWGWDMVRARNRRKDHPLCLCIEDWSRLVLDVIEGANGGRGRRNSVHRNSLRSSTAWGHANS